MLSTLEQITTVDLLRDIVRVEMELPEEKIFIYNQPWLIPPFNDLYVNVAYKYSKAYSTRDLTYPDGEEVSDITEEQNTNNQEFFAIQLLSRNFDALNRRWEVHPALRSVYAQQLMEKYAFKLSWNGAIQDLSSLEASAMLYRMEIPVTLLTAYQKVKKVNYFDLFNTKVVANMQEGEIVNEFVQPLTDPTA